MKKFWYKFHDLYLHRRKLNFISWFDARFPGKYCWTDCVTWAFSPVRFNPFRIEGSRGCEVESTVHEFKTCYCGAWSDGVCFDRLPRSEQKRIREEMSLDHALHADEIPF